MQQAEVHPQCLRRQVEAECHQYAAAYEPPEKSETLGAPWSKEEVSANVEDMASLVVAPYHVEYDSSDDLQAAFGHR